MENNNNKLNVNKNKETVSLEELKEIAKIFPKMTVKEFLELKRKYN